MSLKTTVKVSHLSNLSDARYCAGMGVEMLGFGVIPGADNYMPPNVFQDIRGWVAGPSIVAELYGLSNDDEVREVVSKYAPDYFELSYEEYRKYHASLSLPCMVYFPDTGAAAAVADDRKITHAIVDSSQTCRDIQPCPVPVLIKVTTLSQLQDKLRSGCFKGVILEGPKEHRPGITNYEHLGSLLEDLEEE